MIYLILLFVFMFVCHLFSKEATMISVSNRIDSRFKLRDNIASAAKQSGERYSHIPSISIAFKLAQKGIRTSTEKPFNKIELGLFLVSAMSHLSCCDPASNDCINSFQNMYYFETYFDVIALCFKIYNVLCALFKKSRIEYYFIYFNITNRDHFQSFQEFMPEEHKNILYDINRRDCFNNCQGLNLNVYPINDLAKNHSCKISFGPISTKMTDVLIKHIFASELRDVIKKVTSSSHSLYSHTRIYEPIGMPRTFLPIVLAKAVDTQQYYVIVMFSAI